MQTVLRDIPADRILTVICLMVIVTGCNVVDIFSSGSTTIDIRTDSTEYVLQYEDGMYFVEMDVEIHNLGVGDVFLHRMCGYMDDPGYELERAVEDIPVYLGRVPCITRPLRDPIPLETGETFAYTLELQSPEGLQATMEERTGEFVLKYQIQRIDSVRSWQPVDLIPEHERLSPQFVVVEPSEAEE